MTPTPTLVRDRILTEEECARRRDEGWLAADLHAHSSCSHDVLPSPELHPEAIYQAALDAGMDYVTITDHDTMDAYDLIGWERERLVTGVEISLCDPGRVGHTIHVNVYTLNKEQFLELKAIAHRERNLERFIDFVRAENLPHTYNHPFWFVSREKPNYMAVKEIAPLFPVLEYNMKRIQRKNMLAMWLADAHGKGMTASTDTHTGRVGRAFTLSRGSTFREFFANIANREAYICPQDLTFNNLNLEISAWVDTLLSLHRVRVERTRYTGIPVVDHLINFAAVNTQEDYPRFFKFMNATVNELSRISLFAHWYLFLQNRNARKIGKLLDIPDFA